MVEGRGHQPLPDPQRVTVTSDTRPRFIKAVAQRIVARGTKEGCQLNWRQALCHESADDELRHVAPRNRLARCRHPLTAWRQSLASPVCRGSTVSLRTCHNSSSLRGTSQLNLHGGVRDQGSFLDVALPCRCSRRGLSRAGASTASAARRRRAHACAVVLYRTTRPVDALGQILSMALVFEPLGGE